MSLRAQSACLRLGKAVILTGICVEIGDGTLTALVGPNGAGKSSVLRLLSGELRACEGAVLWNNKLLHDISVQDQARLRSVMTQSSHIVFDFLVHEVLHMGWVQGSCWGFNARADALRSVTAECDIGQLVDRKFNTLSGGEQQRVQFARALLQIWQPESEFEPRYLLLDEPTSNLDLAQELRVLRLARRAADRGIGVLVVLHDLNLAARFADRVVLLAHGVVVSAGSPKEVFDAELLSGVYHTPVHVERHVALDRLIINT